MEQEILDQLKKQGALLDEIKISVDRMKRYFFWTLVISVAVIVLPLIGLIFVLPQFLDVVATGYGLY